MFRTVFFKRSDKITYTYFSYEYHSQFPLYFRTTDCNASSTKCATATALPKTLQHEAAKHLPISFPPRPPAAAAAASAVATASLSLIFAAAAATACLQNESANPLQLQLQELLCTCSQTKSPPPDVFPSTSSDTQSESPP